MLTKQGATRLHDATLNWTPNSSSETQPRRHDSGKPPPGAQSQLFSIHGHVGSCWRYRPHPAATFGLSFFRFVLGGDTQEQKIWRKHEDYLSKVFFGGETNSPVLPQFTASCQKSVLIAQELNMGLPFFQTGGFMGRTSRCSIKLA